MPFIYDFNKAMTDVQTVDIQPKGWKGNIIIEYVVSQVNRYDTMLSVVWRVKGTTHCFVIPEQRLNVMSNGDYKKHFTQALEAFRTDYLTWFSDDMYEKCEWKDEYKEQYGRFIIENYHCDNKG